MHQTELLARIHHHSHTSGHTSGFAVVIGIVVVLLVLGVYGYIKYTGSNNNSR